jgi:hypothetical protein
MYCPSSPFFTPVWLLQWFPVSSVPAVWLACPVLHQYVLQGSSVVVYQVYSGVYLHVRSLPVLQASVGLLIALSGLPF